MRIFVDADACPVKDIIIQVGKKYNIDVFMICSVSHFSTVQDAHYIYVDNISQAADLAIINRVQAGDIVITQDYGLASVVLGKRAQALHHSGNIYSEKNIDKLLWKRHVAAKIRRGGGRVKGPRPFTKEDRINFRKKLEYMVLKYKEE